MSVAISPDFSLSLPVLINAGTTCTFNVADSTHSPVDGWSLTFYLAGKVAITVNGVVNGATFDVTLTALQTATLPEGTYAFEIRANKAGVVDRLASGFIPVIGDISVVASKVSHAEKMIGYIEAAMEGRLSAQDAIDAMAFDSRSLRLMQMSELKELRGYYAKELYTLTKRLSSKAIKLTPIIVGRIP